MVAKVQLEERFGDVLEFLSRFGVVPDPLKGLREDEVRLALLSLKGWELTTEQEMDHWRAEVIQHLTLSQQRSAIGVDRDKNAAILEAIQIALTWLSPQEEYEAFDRSVRRLLKMGGSEFLAKWQSGELDSNDPIVHHSLVMRPLGY